MFEHLDQQRAAAERVENERAQRDHKWVSFTHPPALTNEQLTKLREAAAKVGNRALTADEIEVVLFGKVLDKRQAGVRVI